MLSQRELNAIFKYLGITAAGRHYVTTARASPPSRSPSKGLGNVVDIIASRKMRLTIKSESRHAELPCLFNCEFSTSVLEVYDQPPHIKIAYKNANGKNGAHNYTGDFLVIENSCIYIIECKLESKLYTELADRPYLYTRDCSGKWICPPAHAAASELGLQHRIYTDKDFPPTFTRNCIFLFNFIDEKTLSEEELVRVVDAVQQQAGRVCLKVLNEKFSQAAIVQALLKRKIFIDLQRDLLCLPDYTWVYSDKNQFGIISSIRRDMPLAPIRCIDDLHSQSVLFWGTEQWEVLNISSGLRPSISLRKGDQLVTLNSAQLSALFEDQLLLAPLPDIRNKIVEEKILSCRANDLKIAQERQALIKRSEHEEFPGGVKRSIRRWRKDYLHAESVHGCGFLGLIPDIARRGNRTSRLTETQRALLESTLSKKYLTKKSSSAYSAYQDYLNDSRDIAAPTLSLSTFYQHIQKLNFDTVLLSRKGKRAAYAHAPVPRDINLDSNLPSHGDFIFEIAHTDHTVMAMTLWSSLNKEPIEQKLWLSALLDGHSRVILAIYISFEPPSYRTTMMLLRECFRRFGRLPWFIVSDGGADYRSAYFEKTLARLGSNIRHRATSAPRHGSIMERLFGISETELIHTLEANRGNQKLGRGQSSSHNPQKRALWTPDAFFMALKDWAYLTYPEIDRGGIREKPSTRFERSKAQFDRLPGCQIDSPEDFYFNTLPDVKNGLTLNKNQCAHRKITYRLSEHVDGYKGGRQKIEARYDPYDLTYILGLVQGKWVKFFTQDTLVRECKELGIVLAHMEVYPRQTRHNRRYNKVPEASLLARRNNVQQEQLLFTQKQALQAMPLPLSETPAHTPIKIDFQQIPDLPASLFQEDYRNDQ